MPPGLAWELKRNDIIMYDKQGELKYGLDWPDAKNGFVSQSEFASWLAAHRQEGPVSLVLLMDKGENMADLPLPKPDNTYVLEPGCVSPVSAAMSTWICLALASLLSCAGQLCQKQATRPSKSRRRGRHILGWLGPCAAGARRRYAAVAERAAIHSGERGLSHAEPQFCLGDVSGLGDLARAGSPGGTGSASG